MDDVDATPFGWRIQRAWSRLRLSSFSPFCLHLTPWKPHGHLEPPASNFAKVASVPRTPLIAAEHSTVYAAAPPRPKVTFGQLQVFGILAPGSVASLLLWKRDDVENCYLDGLMHDEKLRGEIAIRLVIDEKGNLVDGPTRFTPWDWDSGRNGTRVADCAVNVIRRSVPTPLPRPLSGRPRLLWLLGLTGVGS